MPAVSGWPRPWSVGLVVLLVYLQIPITTAAVAVLDLPATKAIWSLVQVFLRVFSSPIREHQHDGDIGCAFSTLEQNNTREFNKNMSVPCRPFHSVPMHICADKPSSYSGSPTCQTPVPDTAFEDPHNVNAGRISTPNLPCPPLIPRPFSPSCEPGSVSHRGLNEESAGTKTRAEWAWLSAMIIWGCGYRSNILVDLAGTFRPCMN